MTDLSAKKGLLQYEEREFESGDSAIIYNPTKAVGERTKRATVNIGTAAGIAAGTSTVPALYSEAELNAALANSALPVGTAGKEPGPEDFRNCRHSNKMDFGRCEE